MKRIEPKGHTKEEMTKKKLFANCRSVSEFQKIATLGEGTYGNELFII